MADIAIVTGGTRGDVQPYVALGRGLREAGHCVRVLAADNYAGLIAGAGLIFATTGGDVEAMLRSPEWRETIDRGNRLATLRKMRTETKRQAVGAGQRLRDHLAGSDLIIAGIAGLAGTFSVAELLGIPYIQAYVTPFTPTQAFPSPLTPTLPFGAALNRASFAFMRQMLLQMTRTTDDTVRRELDLGSWPRRGPLAALSRLSSPVLNGYSTLVLPRPDDWPANYSVTGYWFLDEAEWAPPADLVAFLDAGDPPVYIGFGSMGGDLREAGRAALDALARTGQRGIIAAGWGGLAADDLPPTMFAVGSLPHRWLFPRMAAVVHHGGVGTTAAALRAGVPSVVVPFSVDQPFWGRRVFELGAGSQPIPRKQLTTERLTRGIAAAVHNSAIRDRAAELGRGIRAEDGIEAAVAIIERFMGRHGANATAARPAAD